ncbi:hypothetical protein [Geomonas propionica]|nr:hypothetical protein [Geomonas propionica]
MKIKRIIEELVAKLAFRHERRWSTKRAARIGYHIAMNGCRF